MSAPVQNKHNDNVEDLQAHAAQRAREVAPTRAESAAQPSMAAEPGGPQPREASANRAPWTPPSLWPRATDSPPTAPDVQEREQESEQESGQGNVQEVNAGSQGDNDTRQPKVGPSALHPRTAPRMPQGLGGPNVALPIGPQLPRTAHAAPPGIDGIDAARPSPQKPEFEGDLAIKALRRRLSLDPEFVPAPQIRKQSGSVTQTLGRLALVVLVAALVAGGITLLSIDNRPYLLAMFKQGDGAVGAGLPAEVQAVGAQPAGAQPAGAQAREQEVSQPVQPAPHLIVEGRQTFANEALPLGVSLNGASGNEFALLTGLTTGTRLSVGGPFGANGWRIAARDLGGAMAYAPKDFVGVMEAAIDLRLPNNTLIDSRSMRLEWVPKQPDKQPEVRTPQVRPDRDEARPTPAAMPAVRALDPAEANLLIKRAQDYLTAGDIVSARLALRRVAATDNAQAALILGASFDPVVFEELGVLGFAADAAQARTWYQRAAELGSTEAMRRLERLGKQAP